MFIQIFQLFFLPFNLAVPIFEMFPYNQIRTFPSIFKYLQVKLLAAEF